MGARLSRAAVGNPYDNAKAESVFKTLTHEEVYLNDYRTFAEAEATIGRFIDDIDNTKRRTPVWATCPRSSSRPLTSIQTRS